MYDITRRRRQNLSQIEDVALRRWQNLVCTFKLNKPGVHPWDAHLLAANFAGASHGEKCTLSFLLHVWNPDEQWACGPFDIIDALRVWNDRQREAFIIWATDPWWP